MPAYDDNPDLVRVARFMGGTVTPGEVEDAGFSRRALYAARDRGQFLELSRGVFRLADAPPVAHLDFVAVCKRARHGTICLESALARWGLIDDIPASVHLAVPKDSTRPSIAFPATTVHVFSRETFAVERLEEQLPTGERYWIYSAQRSVVDAVRLRQRYGGGPGLEALRSYLSRPQAKRGALLGLARQLNVERALLNALEILG